MVAEMKVNLISSKRIVCVVFCIFLLLQSHIDLAGAQENSKNTDELSKSADPLATEGESDRFVTIDFNDVDILVFIKFISELTGKNFVIDQKVKGNVTIISPTKISIAEAYKVFESVLEVHGYGTIVSGEVIKIVPSIDARTKNVETKLREGAISPEDKIVTQIIPLKYADADDVKSLFTPIISKSSIILSYQPTNTLIVTDVLSNISRLLKIIGVIDVTGVGQEISVIPLEYSDATKLASILGNIFQPQKIPKKGAAEPKINFVADERTNTIIILASEVDIARVKQLIKLLDKDIPRGKEKIHVYYLENATSEELAKVLQALPTQKSTAAKGKKETPVVSEDVRITADKATNSLIIMAEKDDYLVLEEIIKKLDIPRAMVYIESLIMEVSVDKDFNLGIEWIAAGETSYQNREGIYGGGFIGGENAGLTAGTLPAGFSLGVFGEFIQIAGVSFPSISAIVKAYKKDKDVHILSTPQILTTDNKEASIIVGKNVPFQTRSAAESAIETYSSFEYKDVGITLKITPQISKDRLVRLNIYQEVTKLDELATTSNDRPTTLKRTIDTTVIVKDGNTVVIGGLIDDSFSETEYRVPCLGDIPGLGWLFRSKSRSSEKTNLFVFLTPRVLKNPEEAKLIQDEKQDQMDKIIEGEIKLYKKESD